MKSVSGGGMTEAMEQASVEVDMTVREIGGAWNVDFCMVWYSPTSAHTVRSGEDYSSAEDAIAEMKRKSCSFCEKWKGQILNIKYAGKRGPLPPMEPCCTPDELTAGSASGRFAWSLRIEVRAGKPGAEAGDTQEWCNSLCDSRNRPLSLSPSA